MFIPDIKDYKDLFQDGYLKIRNHGIISNNRTAILVGMEGTIDWACNIQVPQPVLPADTIIL